MAIFVKGGVVCDLFYPGTYTLSTGNLPFLGKLMNLPFGGRTPFSAEVYFVNTVTKLDLNWGTTGMQPNVRSMHMRALSIIKTEQQVHWQQTELV